MKKYILILGFFCYSIMGKAQIDPGLLFVLSGGTTAEIGTITTPVAGMLIYNSDEGKMYLNNGLGFSKIPSIDTNSVDFWGPLGTAGTDDTINFLGTTDAQDMVIRANNQERLRLSATNQTLLLNSATQYNNYPFSIRANGDDLIAFQTSAGTTEWQLNLLGNGLNFSEAGVADYRIFLEQGGNVGIDTDTPSERLDVNGAIRVRNITTTSSDLDVLVTTATGVVQKRPFADFSGSGIAKLNFGGRWTNTDITTNLNVDNVVAPIFGSEDYKDDGNNLYEVSGNTLIIKETGRYDIRANLSFAAVADGNEDRTNTSGRLAVNGTPIGAFAGSGYIRYQGGGTPFNTTSSIHISEILQLNANDTVSIIMFQKANSGAVNFSAANESSFSINKLR